MRKASKVRFRSIAGGDRFTCSRLALLGSSGTATERRAHTAICPRFERSDPQDNQESGE
jgi:hypothetical protein